MTSVCYFCKITKMVRKKECRNSTELFMIFIVLFEKNQIYEKNYQYRSANLDNNRLHIR